MQAVTFEQLGGPEALRLREIDEPQLRANQVLVRVQAVAVDHVDTFVRSGRFKRHWPRRTLSAVIWSARYCGWRPA